MPLLEGLNFSNELSSIIYFFAIYSFIGWILENTHSLFTRKKFFKPNFLLGPFKPMYGFAPILLVYLVSPNMHWTLLLLLCFLIPTAVEYISGVWLERRFNRKWWDYTGHSLNLQGHICLTYSFCWIFLSLICIYFIHPIIRLGYEKIEFLWSFVWPIVIVYFVVEIILAFKRHTLQGQSMETLG